MKLATLDDGTRDGQLAVVSRDLKTAHVADGIAPSLRAALDDWPFIAPQLDVLYRQLNEGKARRPFDFDPARCLAPLPRASGRVCGAAYLHHHELERRAVGADLPAAWRDAPQLAWAAGDGFLGPRQDLVLAREEWGIDFGAELAVVSGDLAPGATLDEAHGQIRLLLLANDVTLQNLAADVVANERSAGLGLLHAKPATAFAPVAVTPDELGEAWRGGKAALPLRVVWNGNPVGALDAGEDMAFSFPQLLAALAGSRKVAAGTIVGTGVVANRATRRHTPGYASIATQCWQEILDGGEAVTQYLRFGDTVRIEMLDENGKSLFGAIEQTLTAP